MTPTKTYLIQLGSTQHPEREHRITAEIVNEDPILRNCILVQETSTKKYFKIQRNQILHENTPGQTPN